MLYGDVPKPRGHVKSRSPMMKKRALSRSHMVVVATSNRK